MLWSFFDIYFAVYIAFAVCTVLLYIKGPLQLDQKLTYGFFFLVFIVSALFVMFFEFPTLSAGIHKYSAFVFNKTFFDFGIMFFFFLTFCVLVFILRQLQVQKVKEEFYILLYFFLFGSYLLFKITDLGLFYLVIELPRISSLCFSCKL